MQHDSSPEAMATADLVKELAADASLLVQRQLKLAELEVKSELKQGKTLLELFGASGLAAYAGVVLLLVAGALALGELLGHGLALGPLIVAAALLLPSAIVGLNGYKRMKQLKKPLERSRAELTKEIAWSKTLKM